MLYVTTVNRTDLFNHWAICTCKKTVTIYDTWNDAECEHCGRHWYLPEISENLLISDEPAQLAMAAQL